MINKLLQKYTFTDTEVRIINDTLGEPLIQKYFASLAAPIMLDLASNMEPKEGESAESFLRRRVHEHGRLEALNTLLSFPVQPS